MAKPQFFPIPLKSRFSRPHFFLPLHVIFETCEFVKIQIPQRLINDFVRN